jgi:hypothetical protein
VNGNEPLLVSLHLPKTAGTSFQEALRARYGDGLLRDYVDLPLHQPRGRREVHALRSVPRRRAAVRAGVTAVHGHFLPVAYRLALAGRPVRFVTWLREPLQRLASHYHFWRRNYDGRDPRQVLRNKMVREAWTLERFCLGPELRNLYRQYLWAFDPNRFDAIGVTERYADDAREMVGDSVASGAPNLRANPEREGDYVFEPALERRVRAWHAADVALYDWVAAGRPGRFRWP